MSASHDLFVKGGASYLAARNAIRAFENEACEICKEVYNSASKELAECMGVASGPCDDYQGGKLPDWAGLGVKRSLGRTAHVFYIYLCWRQTARGADTEVAAMVCLEMPSKGACESIRGKITARNPGCGIEYQKYGL